MKQQLKIAFTLIELLVVIAVIGILSGLIVVSMNGVTNKATIAKAQVFSNSLRNSLMLNLVSEWRFDGNSNDSWGANNGTMVGAPSYKGESDCVYGQCVELNGSGDYFTLTNPITMTGEFTFTAWAYRDTNSGYDFLTGMTGNDCKIGFNSGNDKVFARIIAGGSWDVSSSSNAITGKWHYVVVTRNSSNKVDVFVDAGGATRLFGDVAQTGSFQMSIIGNDSSDHYFDGKIDGVAIYNSSVPTSQIKKQYYLGLNSLLIKGQISTSEYVSMIDFE